jgi:hypothetical protein
VLDKRARDLKPNDRIKTGLVGIPRTVHAVDHAGKWVIVHVLLDDGPNTSTAWSVGRTRALRKRPWAWVQMAD